MKMHLVSLLVLVCFTTTITNAQQLEKWSDTDPNTGGSGHFEQSFGQDESGYYALKSGGSGWEQKYWIHTVSSDLSSSTSVPLDFDNGVSGHPIRLHQIFRLNGKTYLTKTDFFRQEKKLALILEEVTPEGKLVNSVQLINTTFDKVLMPGSFEVSISEDRSKIVVLHVGGFQKKVTTFPIQLSCLNAENFEQIWSKEVDMPIPSQRYPSFKVATDNAGNAVVYSKIKKDKEHYHSLHTYNASSGEFKTHDLGLTTKQLIVDSKFVVPGDGEFSFIGTYHDKDLMKNSMLQGKILHGHFNFKLFNVDQLNNATLQPISDEILNLVVKDVAKLKGERYFFAYDLKETYTTSSGKIIMLLENVKTTSALKTTGSPGAQTSVTIYKHSRNSILILCLDPNTGKLDWSNIIKKAQFEQNKTKDARNISYIPYFKNDEVHILWNNTKLKNAGSKWTERDGTEIVKENVFGKYATYGTFYYVVAVDVTIKNAEYTHGKPVSKIYSPAQKNVQTLQSSVYFADKEGLVIIMHYRTGRQFKFGRLTF
jgi:hypothetical protein